MENYCEKYVPVKIQSMIMENVSFFVNKDIMNKLKSKENKLYTEITDMLLTDDGKGSIFNNIVEINEELT